LLARNQEVDQLTAALDRLALEKVTANLHLPRDGGKTTTALSEQSGVELLSTDKFYACDAGVGEQVAAAKALYELKREAQQKFSTLPEAPGVVTVMSGLSRMGGTRLGLYAVNKIALGSLDVMEKSSKIKVIVQLLDASGNELESSELSLEPRDENRAVIPLILEQGRHSAADIGDVRIWPGLRTHPGAYSPLISTSWTGDVYVDIETEKLPQLKSCKLSVSMPEFPNNTPAQTPTESVGARRAEQSASGGNGESQSQVAVSPNTMPKSIEVRRAEIVGSDGRGGSTVSKPTGEIGTDGPGAKSTPIAVATPEPEQSPVVKNADVVLSAPTPVQTTAPIELRGVSVAGLQRVLERSV
jgi:hypothetical protein